MLQNYKTVVNACNPCVPQMCLGSMGRSRGRWRMEQELARVVEGCVVVG